jgi:hypothetical protein
MNVERVWPKPLLKLYRTMVLQPFSKGQLIDSSNHVRLEFPHEANNAMYRKDFHEYLIEPVKPT